MQINMFEDIQEQTKAPTGNRTLVKSGVQTEESDFRAHVCYPVMRTYVFPTSVGKSLVAQADQLGLACKSSYQEKFETARGYPTPISYFERLQEILIPVDIWRAHPIHKDMLTSTKGLIATTIVVALLKRDMIALPVMLNQSDNKALQISGTDILINAYLRLQVKCDLPGGDRRYGGTGNLFLQVEECNPFKRY